MHRTLLILLFAWGSVASAQQSIEPGRHYTHDPTSLIDGPLGPTVWLDAYQDDAVRMASNPALLQESLVDQFSQAVADQAPAPGQRQGVFQKVNVVGTWMPAMQSGDFGSSDLRIDAVFGFPFPVRERPLLITPLFQTHFFDGPTTPDLPARVYDATLQFRWLGKIGDGPWAYDFVVEPGVHSDFESGSDEGFRLTGRALAVYDWNEASRLVMGVAYFDRNDVGVLPVGGLIWTPNDAVKVEVLFPRPRVAFRPGTAPCIDNSGCLQGGFAPWGPWYYLAGEFGGGQYAITRASSAEDVISWRDYRILLGIESDNPGGLNWQFEVGYVFGRKIEYASATPDFEADPTVLLRYGMSY